LKRTINISTTGAIHQLSDQGDSPLKFSQLLDDKDGLFDEKDKGMIPRANPILPKMLLNEVKEPPSCPLKDIQFI